MTIHVGLINGGVLDVGGGCFSPDGNVVAVPTFSPVGGSYAGAQTVTISCATVGATIYYTTDGSTPTTSSSVYSTPLNVSSNTTLKALGVFSPFFANSAVASATYSFGVATPTLSPAAGIYGNTVTVTLACATTGATIHYTTDGSTPTSGSPTYSAPFAVSTTETINAIAVLTGYTNSAVGTATYTLTVSAPSVSPATGTYNNSQLVMLSCATTGASLYYTTDGSTPTTSSTLYTAQFNATVSETINVLAAKSGYNNSAIGSSVITLVAATPTFSPAAGTYNNTQSVTVNNATSGVSMFYTTDGSTPTTGSTPVSGAITVAAAETLKVLATKTGYTNSSVGSAAYAFTVATPTFSPSAGSYVGTQSVTISSATTGVTIYYTTDGSTPTTSSTLYTGAISVASTETVKALATLSGYTNSAIGSATYTISTGALQTLAALPTATVGSTTYSYQIYIPVAGSGTTTYALTNYSSDQPSGSGVYVAPTPQNSFSISSAGLLTGTINGVEKDYFLITATRGSTSVPAYFSLSAINATSPLLVATPIVLGYVQQSSTPYTSGTPLATAVAVGNTASVTWTLTSQTTTGSTNNNWAINASTGAITGTPTNLGVNTLNVSVTDGTYTATAPLCVMVTQYVASAPRPSYNTGSGFFVLNGNLYDANGNLFQIMGCDREHFNSSNNGFLMSENGFNAVRFTLYANPSQNPESSQVSALITAHLNNHQFVIVMRYSNIATFGSITSSKYTTGSGAGGNAQVPTLAGCQDQCVALLIDWYNYYSLYAPIMNKIAINFANELGPTAAISYQYLYQGVIGNISSISGTTITVNTVSTTNPFANCTNAFVSGGGVSQVIGISSPGGMSGAWTVQASSAITGYTSGGTLNAGIVAALRAMGYTCPIVIDSGASGQDANDFLNYSAAIWNSDPQKNLIFSYHLYGGDGYPYFDGQTTSSGTGAEPLNTFFQQLATLRQTYGMHFGLYEFGPPAYPPTAPGSWTLIPVYQVLQSCAQYGISWCGWAMDGITAPGSQTGDYNSFGMRYQDYPDTGLPSNKTRWGKYAQLDPINGAMSNSQQQTSF